MKTIIYSIPTLNGFIAIKDEKSYEFISDNSWKRYIKTLKEAGVFIMGKRTYEASLKTGAFPYNCLNIVMTKEKIDFQIIK
ncbi:hypothetical protein FJZ21_03450 [Candidatus Pacearchaeota archaeon]|nr:hypothetical protein [Candidatus Pacearchaeota archaeon]